MQCSEFQQHIDDRLDNQLSEELRTDMDAHLENCASCRDSMHAEQTLREMLSNMPVTEPSTGFAARALRQAAMAHSTANAGPQRLAFAAGATAMLVAGVVLWFVTGVHNPQGEAGLAPQPQMAEVNLHMKETHQIRLAFNAPTDMEKVLLTLEFPENVELVNYSGRKRIAWHTPLYKGDNVLTLPLSGLKTSKGIFIARVNTGKSSSEIQINLNVQELGIATTFRSRIAA